MGVGVYISIKAVLRDKMNEIALNYSYFSVVSRDAIFSSVIQMLARKSWMQDFDVLGKG